MNFKDTLLHQTTVSVINSNCQKYENELAVILEDEHLTYGELHQKSEILYQYLTTRGLLQPNTLVGLCMEPSLEMAIAIYTILKAGAAFVPLDPDLPRQRLSYMIADAKLTTVLTQQKFAFDIEPAIRQSGFDGQMCFLDNPNVWQPLTTSSALPSVVKPEQLAYIIYTSGSTGVPKGVMLTHQGLLNLAQASCNTFNIKPGLRLLQFASISFDAAVWEIFTALCGGATLVLGAREKMLPGQLLADFITKYSVEWIMLPPSVLATLTPFRDRLSSLKMVVVGGEACPVSLAQAWVSPHTRFFNAYGPTEITVCCTMHEFGQQDTNLPIGYALPNVELYILDEELKRCSRGEKGELYVGGIGVARGYLDKPEITNTRFLDNPFGSGKIYKTGDIVYEDLDRPGLIHYAGRSDHQVKIRGKRIEIEAIEMIIAQHPGVQTNAVKAIRSTRIDKNSDMPENHCASMLAAYIVPKAGQFLTQEHLQRFAAEQLPDYMVPNHFVFLDELPLLPNRSKVDRNALPEQPQIPYYLTKARNFWRLRSLQRQNVRPQIPYSFTSAIDNSLKIAVIFDEALELPTGTCKPHTDFFAMGGSSLCIAHVLYALNRDFDITLPARLIYEHPTPACLTQLLEQLKLKSENNIDDKHIDLKAEAQLPPDLHTSTWQQLPQAKYDCALITGTTGFLGAHLLDELLTKGIYRKIYCLIRAKSQTDAIARLRAIFIKYQLPMEQLSQVNIIVGDIQAPQLQLSTKLFDKLGEKVDQIYHLAADTSYIKPYSVIKKSNIDGTANILTLAAHRRHKMLHYVSTVSVYGSLSSLLNISEVSEDFNIDLSLPIMSVEYGYVRSKWAAERMVRSAKEKGLAVSIYRPGFISGHTKTGAANIDDTFHRFVSGCLKMGIYPDLPEKYWNPVPVDYVAAAIAHISSQAKYINGNYNIVVPREQELSNVEIFECLSDLGYPLQKISTKNWLNALSTLPTTNPLYPLVSFFQENIYQDRSTILEVNHRTPICLVNNTVEAIKDSGILCPTVNKKLIRQYLPKFDPNFSTKQLPFVTG